MVLINNEDGKYAGGKQEISRRQLNEGFKIELCGEKYDRENLLNIYTLKGTKALGLSVSVNK